MLHFMQLLTSSVRNLALVTLFRAGVIHRICAQKSTEKAKRDFIILMAHLFGRKYLPKAYTTSENLKEVVKRSPSIVLLPPMPEYAKKVLIQHNKEIQRIFSGYALAFATRNSAEMDADCALPLSQHRYPALERPIASTTDLPFLRHLESTAIDVVTRSPFVATSGHNDDVKSVEELIASARTGLHLNKSAIPTMEHLTGEDGRATHTPLNAYLLDFYMHGQTTALAAANGIRRGEVWFLLQDFDLTLMTIRGALEQLLLKASSAEPDVQESVGDTEDDSGYVGTASSIDLGEADDEEGVSDNSNFKRPQGVGDADWRVYEVVDKALREFNAKFKAMWA
jgi:hypothetical protein